MEKTGRGRFFKTLVTGFVSIAFFRNFNFAALRKKAVEDYPVKVKINPLAVSRNKPGKGNVR
jgi:hypothetical protein